VPEGVNLLLGDACELSSWRRPSWPGRRDRCATGDDEDNLVVSLLAKQEFAVLGWWRRVNHPNNEWMFTEQWGVDAAVRPAAHLDRPGRGGRDGRRRGPSAEAGPERRGLVELTLREGSSAAGRPMYELRLPLESAIVAIVREGTWSSRSPRPSWP